MYWAVESETWFLSAVTFKLVELHNGVLIERVLMTSCNGLNASHRLKLLQALKIGDTRQSGRSLGHLYHEPRPATDPSRFPLTQDILIDIQWVSDEY